MAFSLPFLGSGPKVAVTPLVVRARSPLDVQVLSLGSYCKSVEIDSRTRTVRIRVRFLWGFWYTETVAFDEVKYITYGMRDDTDSAVSYVSGEREGGEVFRVGLGLKNGKRVRLFSFSGDGELVVEQSNVFSAIEDRIREATDVTGDQQERSLDFVDLVCERIGVSLGP